MKLMKIMQSTSLAIFTMVTGSALAAPTPPAIPTTNPDVPGTIPAIPGSSPSIPAAVPATPNSIPGTPIETISLAFVGSLKGAPAWNNIKAKKSVQVQFTLTKGSEKLTNPGLVTSRTVSGVDCNTGSAIVGSSYGSVGTPISYNKGLKSFKFKWKLPSNAAKGSCISLNIEAGAGLGGTSKALVKVQ